MDLKLMKLIEWTMILNKWKIKNVCTRSIERQENELPEIFARQEMDIIVISKTNMNLREFKMLLTKYTMIYNNNNNNNGSFCTI